MTAGSFDGVIARNACRFDPPLLRPLKNLSQLFTSSVSLAIINKPFPTTTFQGKVANERTSKISVRRDEKMADVFEKVREIIVERLKVDPSEVTPDAAFVEDLRADSLDIVEMVMKLEETFDISIPDEDVEKLRTVGDAVAYIERRLKEKAGV